MNKLKILQTKGFKIVFNWQECTSKSIFFLNTLNLENFDKYQKLAIKKKCTHIITNSSIEKHNKIRNINYYYVNFQKDLFKIKKIFFGKVKLKIIFLTGTNGKTSIAYGSHLLFSINGIPSCYLGTIGFFINGNKIKNLPNTTPFYLELSSLLQGTSSFRTKNRKILI